MCTLQRIGLFFNHLNTEDEHRCNSNIYRSPILFYYIQDEWLTVTFSILCSDNLRVVALVSLITLLLLHPQRHPDSMQWAAAVARQPTVICKQTTRDLLRKRVTKDKLSTYCICYIAAEATIGMSSNKLSAVLEEQIRRLCLNDFPCGYGSWVSFLQL